MPEYKEYTLRELGLLLENFIADNKKDHDRIEAQTTKTNGKVAEVVAWRERMKGVWMATCIFCAVAAVLIPLLINTYYHYAK